MRDEGVETVIRRAIGGDAEAIAAVVAHADSAGDARLVTLAAVLDARPAWLERADTLAVSSRDRQIVAICRSHLAGDTELVDALARDHLADHPDSLIVAWVASRSAP